MEFIRVVNTRRWFDRDLIEELGGVPADAFKGFKTSSNKLSIYYFDDTVPLRRVLAALAANRENLQEIDYAQFPDFVLDELGIKREVALGDTPDTDVNAKHVDLVNLTASQLHGLIRGISDKGTVLRLPRSEVKSSLGEGIEKSFLNPSTMNQRVLDSLRSGAGS